MNKRFFCILLALFMVLSLLTAAAAADGSSFDDVAADEWYAEAAADMAENGIMRGVSEGKFDPHGAVTRGMVVTVLHRMEGTPAPAQNSTFRDVLPDSYCASAVAWAAEQGIVLGYSEAAFGPEDSITREQLALILYRYADWKGFDVDVTGDLSAYADKDSISDYAVTAFAWANGLGLITGTTPTTLTPQGTASRAQIAVVLMRFQEAFGMEEPVGIIPVLPPDTAEDEDEIEPVEVTPLPETIPGEKPVPGPAEGPDPDPQPDKGDDPIPTPQPVRPSK